MELREIRTFLEVADLKSFCRAAEKLKYSQAAVTVQIKQLEKELNVHLFDRIGKQTTLTHEGELFYQYASEIMRNVAYARNALGQSPELTGTLVIGTIESICSTLLPPLIREYHHRYPKVNINIIIDSPEILLNMMNSNQVDMVYFLDRRMYDAKWVKILEKPEEIIFAASKEHIFAKENGLTIDQIITQPLILTEKDASYRFILEQYLASDDKKLHPFLEIGNTEFIIKLLKQNEGISFLPEFTVREDMEQGNLTSLSMKEFYLRTWRQIVYHKDKWLSREMKAFMELVLEMEEH
ncbi:LysR family transcriptional regulator [Lacrimispora defluvii]|uniref:LysR family transcriptional regulator n=1 Tax=Lacrimispora defluvii TaxID=2719233 RepID=A0ABX1W1K0_9FIRM|nr:LysR family transcriptional regulator [Lacrimispora defluvii]NNJ32942.1 LysR family transcriptional regulator [Lacrimispora defluvii]